MIRERCSGVAIRPACAPCHCRLRLGNQSQKAASGWKDAGACHSWASTPGSRLEHRHAQGSRWAPQWLRFRLPVPEPEDSLIGTEQVLSEILTTMQSQAPTDRVGSTTSDSVGMRSPTAISQSSSQTSSRHWMRSLSFLRCSVWCTFGD